MKEFDSFGGFALHCLGLVVAQAEADHHTLEAIGEAVEKKAKERLGSYHDQTGPFVGWADLADITKVDRERQGYSEDEPGVRSGEMLRSIEHKVIGTEAHIGSNDPNMEYFELGTTKQPPRSDLGGALFEIAPKIVEKVGEHVVLALEGRGVTQGKFIFEP